MRRLLFITTLLLCGCSASYYQTRDIKKLDALAIQQQPEFKRLANLLDPCFSGTAKSDTVIKQGKADTLITPGSIVITHVKDTVIKTITTPGRQVVIPTFITVTDTVTDQRALTAQRALFKVKSDSLIVVNTQLSQTTHSKNTWMYIAIGLAVALIGGVAFSIYKFIL